MSTNRKVLLVIVFAQFCCTSLWFAGNAVNHDLLLAYDLLPSALAHLTAAVQFGFITGTLVFALLSFADRFSPSKVFLISALLAGVSNLGLLYNTNTLFSLMGFRFVTGFFLAGIYPVGMKIAADYFQQSLGKSLGFLVGALVLGTALPHLLKDLTATISWTSVIWSTTLLSFLGGSLMALLIPDGPFRKKGNKLKLQQLGGLFKHKDFRMAAFGYFGHMWELYTFWAFVPVMLFTYYQKIETTPTHTSLLAFAIIATGGLACVCSGYAAQKFGTKKIAGLTLALSGMCCLVSPLFFTSANEILFIGFLFFWGAVVVADSPLFSTLVAHNADAKTKGTALTLVNCLGYSLTIISIQLIAYLSTCIPTEFLFMILGIGPAFGVLALVGKRSNTN